MYSTENLRYVMDETSAPYNENEYHSQQSDKEFEDMIINKYKLVTIQKEK